MLVGGTEKQRLADASLFDQALDAQKAIVEKELAEGIEETRKVYDKKFEERKRKMDECGKDLGNLEKFYKHQVEKLEREYAVYTKYQRDALFLTRQRASVTNLLNTYILNGVTEKVKYLVVNGVKSAKNARDELIDSTNLNLTPNVVNDISVYRGLVAVSEYAYYVTRDSEWPFAARARRQRNKQFVRILVDALEALIDKIEGAHCAPGAEYSGELEEAKKTEETKDAEGWDEDEKDSKKTKQQRRDR